jgi:hypothetical protein
MRQAGSQPAEQPVLIPALCCGLLSAILIRCGFFSVFFLIPLGFTAFMYNARSAWRACAASVCAHILITVIVFFQAGPAFWAINILYVTVVSLGFTWIIAGGITGRVRAVYRFAISASAGAMVLLLLFFNPVVGLGFTEVLTKQAELLSSLYSASAGSDAVKQSVIEYALTPEKVVEILTQLMLKGGALASCLVLYFFSRQASAFAARVIRRRKLAQSLSAFHAPGRTIWALSISLGAVLLCTRLGLKIPEIVAWNFLVICGIIYLAQGAGIVLYKLENRSAAARFICVALFFAIILSPGINAAGLGLLILLGIAENWLPLRIPRESSAPTPGL